MTRGRLTTALSLVLLAGTTAAPSASAREGGPQVVVRIVDQGRQVAQQAFSLAEVGSCSGEGCVAATYTLRTDDGREPAAGQCPNGVSLAALIERTDPDATADAVTYTQVLDATGVSHPLDQGQLGPTGADDLPPAVCSDGSSITYIRPLRDGSDANVSADPDRNGFFQTSPGQGQTLEVIAHLTGRLLRPTITATPRGTRSYDFTATVPDAPPGVSATWDFGDGTQGSGPTTSHRFAPTREQSSFTVTLTVYADDGSSGRAQRAVSFTVAPDQDGGGGGGGDGGDGPPTGGASDDTGTTGGSRGTPGQPTASPSSGGTAADPGSGAEAGGAGATAPPPPESTPRTDPSRPDGVRVRGRVLTLAAAPAPATGITPDPAPATSGSADDTVLRLPRWLLLTLVGVALYAAGAAMEMMGPRRRRPARKG